MKKNFILLILFILVGCHTYDFRLSITKNSKSNSYVAISNDDFIKNSEYLGAGNSKKERYVREIRSKKLENIIFRGSLENYINDSADKKLRLFVISKEVYDNNSWEKICSEKLYEKVGIYSLKELDKIDWIVNIDSIK